VVVMVPVCLCQYAQKHTASVDIVHVLEGYKNQVNSKTDHSSLLLFTTTHNSPRHPLSQPYTLMTQWCWREVLGTP